MSDAVETWYPKNWPRGFTGPESLIGRFPGDVLREEYTAVSDIWEGAKERLDPTQRKKEEAEKDKQKKAASDAAAAAAAATAAAKEAAKPAPASRKPRRRSLLDEDEGGLLSTAPTYRRTLLGY